MSTLRTNILQNAGGSASVPVDTVISGSAKAWVNFNGTGTVAIRAAFNVSSITDNGTGDYTVNFTTAMPDANYVFLATSGRASSNLACICANRSDLSGVSSVRFQSGYINGAGTSILEDQLYPNVSIFR